MANTQTGTTGYRAWRRLGRGTVAAAGGAVRPGGGAESYTYYDQNGQVLKTYNAGHDPQESAGQPTATPSAQYHYDAAGRKVWEQTLVSTSSGDVLATVCYEYDDANRVIKTWSAGNVPTNPNSPSGTPSTETEYDEVGNVVLTKQHFGTLTSDPVAVSSMTYDSENRVTIQQQGKIGAGGSFTLW